MPGYSWATEIAALVVKDLRVELRTRYAINTLVMFALVTLFALGVTFARARLDATVHAALIWIIVFFSSQQALAGGFIREEEARTAPTLRLYANPLTVFFGKLLVNIIILTVLVVFLLPLYYILMNPTVAWLGEFVIVMALGVFGMCATSAVTAAMVSRTSVKGALFTVLTFPITLPLMLVAIAATTVCIRGDSSQKLWDALRILIAYPVVVTALSSLLFEYVWND